MSVVAYARILREDMEEDLRSVEAGILSGAQSWDEYLGLVGKRRGLMQALQKLEETTRRFDEQD